MASLNKVSLIGRVGQDPEVRSTGSGTKVANFSLATSEKYKKADGTQVDTTEWHRIVVWKQLADICEKYVKKGDQIYIEGKITTRKWEKDGETKYSTEIVGQNLVMLGGKKESSESTSAPSQGSEQAHSAQEDDLPF